MVKRGKTKSEPAAAESDIKPTAWSYVQAVAMMAWGWLKSHKLRSLLIVVIATGTVVLLAVITSPSPAALTNDEIVTRVNKELSIAGDGNPAVLTVEDNTKATQPFLQGAENGDKVLLYYKSKKSILYRPSEQRIIHEGAYTPPDAKLFVRQGTAEDSRVEDIKQQLKTLKNVELISQDKSPRDDYQGVVIVDITDRYDEKVSELEALFDTQSVRIPDGESFPDADILIIVGS